MARPEVQLIPEKKQRRKPKKNFATKPHAIHVTVYDPQGSPVPKSVLDEVELRVFDVAQRHNLLIARATT